MHELLLHAAVPASRHDQILSILAGLAATQPIPIHRQHQVYKPNRTPGASRPAQVGAAQDVDVSKSQKQMLAAMAGELYYLQVVTDIRSLEGLVQDSSVASRKDNDSTAPQATQIPPAPSDQRALTPSPPTLQFYDVPDPARQNDRAVTTRFMASIPLSQGSPAAFLAALDYLLVTTYASEGHRLTYNNTNLQVYRVLVPSSSSSTKLNHDPVKEWRLLDESGGWILEASVKVLDGSKVETMTRGMTELLGLRDTLKGVVELNMVERLSLDTRVKMERV